MTEPVETVQWPGKAYSQTDADLSAPILAMLKNLANLNADDSYNVKFFTGTPYSLQVISSGASSLTKWAATAVGAVGGASAIGAAIKVFWTSNPTSVQPVLIASLAILGAAAFLAVAIMVQADVRARSVATAAREGGTADVVTAMFKSYQYGIQSPTRYAVKKAGDWFGVKSLIFKDGKIVVLTEDEDQVPLAEIDDMVDLRAVLKPVAE